MDVDAIAIIDVAAEEVVLVAGHAAGAASETKERLRGAADKPVGDIEIVHVLFHNVVAGEFGEVEPVARHVFGVTPVALALLDPWHAAVP